MAAQDTLIGRTIGGYQLTSRLGRGGMASVYLARDQKLQRDVAVKLLHGVDATDPGFRARFEQEALATARLDHPNIVHIYDYGVEGDLTFMVMEYCPNGTLFDLMARASQQGKPIEPDYAASLVSQIAMALDFAHQHGIIHRDIKPSNILFAKDGRPVLADLGISKALTGPKLTRTQTTLGTPEYMSPEQGRGEQVDSRSDLYSLGVVLYEILAGRPPYAADTPWGVIYRHMSETPAPIRQQNPRVSVALASVLDRAMAKQPAERFQSGREFAEGLQLAVQRPNQPVTAAAGRRAPTPAPLARADEPTIVAAPALRPATPGAAPSRQRKASPLRWLLPAAALLAALAVVFGVFALPNLLSSRSEDPIVETGDASTALATSAVVAVEPTPEDTPTAAVIERPMGTSRPGPALPPALPAPEATAVFPWQPVATIDEDFAEPSAQWPTVESANSRWRVEDGAYRLTIQEPNNMVWIERGLDVGDFALSFDALSPGDADGAHFGVLFRSDGAGNFYRLDYAPQLGAELSKRVDGQDVVLIARVADQRAEGANRLEVTASGPSLEVLVDGQLVGGLTDDSLARGDLALYGVSGPQGPAEFAFDKFFLEPLASEAVPVVLVPYKDPAGDFSVHVPQDWPAGADALGTSFESPNRLARVIVFPVAGAAPGDAAVDVARKALEQAQSIYPSFRVGQGGPRQLAGLPAFEQSLTGQVLGVDVVARLVAFNQDGRGYAVVTVAQAAADAALQPLLAFVVDTFRPGSPPPEPAATDTPSPAATATQPPPTATATPGVAAPTATQPPAPTSPPAAPGVVVDFETFGVWERGDEPHGTLAQSNERKQGGNYAAKLAYDMPAVANNYVVFLRKPPLAIPGQPDALNVWVYGDGSGHFLNAWIQDAQGEVRQFSFGQVQHSNSWQQMTLPLDVTADWPQGHISGPDNDALDYPIKLFALVLDAAPDGAASKGTIYLDDLGTGPGTAAPSSAGSSASGGSAPAAPTAPPAAPAALSGRIVFTSDNNVAALDVVGGNTWPVFYNGRQPDIRADGRVVVNGVGGGKDNVFTINLDGSGEIMTGRYPEDSYPHWSPSGVSAVFYSTLQGDGRERIYVQTDMTHSEEPRLLKVNGVDVYGRHPIWLQNWRIAYTGCDYWASGSNCGIWTADSSGAGNPTQLTQRSDDRSTDNHGNTLLFSSRAAGNWEVFAVPVNGGAARNLTNSPSHDVGATFSPDGGSIAFMSDRDGGWGIWVMSADGSNPRRLFRVANGFGSDWENERLAWR
jgi:hypothetical protein